MNLSRDKKNVACPLWATVLSLPLNKDGSNPLSIDSRNLSMTVHGLTVSNGTGNSVSYCQSIVLHYFKGVGVWDGLGS